MLKSTYHISKMDCPSEEALIRMKLEGIDEIRKLEFDIAARTLYVYHEKENMAIEERLNTLNLGTKKVATIAYHEKLSKPDTAAESKMLWTVLIINFGFFLLEMTTGLISRSMGLVADSLDMLADAIVYALSLWAVGSTVLRKKKVASLSGYFQLTLATVGIAEVVRRFVAEEALPDYRTMIIVSALALIANAVSLYLLQKSKSQEAHMKASMIFTSNDIIINAGIITAGVLVLLTDSKYPDLLIGALVFIIVIRGAFNILKLGK